MAKKDFRKMAESGGEINSVIDKYFDFYGTAKKFMENSFVGAPRACGHLPTYEEARGMLPQPYWEGHGDVIDCHDAAWRIAFSNLRHANDENRFVSDYIDTAFNDCIFIWDSVFMMMFGRYGRQAYNFQKTLDNFYCKQHLDGYICREIHGWDGEDQFHRYDPASTGPNVLAWAEWEYYLNFADRERLERVFIPLLNYHRWLKEYRTWQDGTYWHSGLSSGMDNQARHRSDFGIHVSHGHLSWIDACAQMVLSGQMLLKMAAELGRSAEIADIAAEQTRLIQHINDCMWEDSQAFYFDRRNDGTLTGVKSIAGYWTLLANIVPRERLEAFVAHLDNENEFKRAHRVPSLSADNPAFNADDGGYWNGAVWAPTNYMLLRGLDSYGKFDLAHEIAVNSLDNVVKVFLDTGTLWEDYASESARPGHAKSNFVGWSGIFPITMLYEYVFGIRADVPNRTIVWDVRLTESHGVNNYPFGLGAALNLNISARADGNTEPQVTAAVCRGTLAEPLRLIVRWGQGNSKEIPVG